MICIGTRGVEATLCDIILANTAIESSRKYYTCPVYGNNIKQSKMSELFYYSKYSDVLYINDINITDYNSKQLLVIISKINDNSKLNEIVLNLKYHSDNIAKLIMYIESIDIKLTVLDDYSKTCSQRLLKYFKPKIKTGSTKYKKRMMNVLELSKDCKDFGINYQYLKALTSFSSTQSSTLYNRLITGEIKNGTLELAKSLLNDYKKHIKELIEKNEILIDDNVMLLMNEWIGMIPVLFKKKYYIVCMIKSNPKDSYLELFSFSEDLSKIKLEYNKVSETKKEVFENCVVYSIKGDSTFSTTESVYEYFTQMIGSIIEEIG